MEIYSTLDSSYGSRRCYASCQLEHEYSSRSDLAKNASFHVVCTLAPGTNDTL